jgi:hypothetical protein
VKHRWLVLVGVALSLVVASGCKKKAGDSCSGNEASCPDKGSILECQDGKLTAMTCKGPTGCSETHKGSTTAGRTVTHNYAVQCDFTGNAPGDPCLDDEAQCSADKKAMVSCKNKKIEVHKCLGAKGCAEGATMIECDTSIQTAGEACEGEDVACTPDKKQILKCKGAKFAIAENCRGPKACSVDGRKISCDSGEQAVGDVCSSDGDYACQTDKKAVLKCAGSKWVVEEKCSAKKNCVTRGNEVGCS